MGRVSYSSRPQSNGVRFHGCPLQGQRAYLARSYIYAPKFAKYGVWCAYLGCQSCQQHIAAIKALNNVTTLKTCVLPLTMFMYILCEGLVEPKQKLFFSCCPSSHCQLLQYNQLKKKCINILLRIQILQTFLIFWPSGCLQSQDKESQQCSSTKQQERSLVWKMAPFLSMTSFRNINLSIRQQTDVSALPKDGADYLNLEVVERQRLRSTLGIA